jgi:hypothetical protein
MAIHIGSVRRQDETGCWLRAFTGAMLSNWALGLQSALFVARTGAFHGSCGTVSQGLTKHQGPSSKLQISSKHQTPISASRGNVSHARVCSLMFGAYLELGAVNVAGNAIDHFVQVLFKLR